jgi:ribosomal protein S18 acetylase RimI-like enzyme
MKTPSVRDATIADTDSVVSILREFHEERATASYVHAARDAVQACIDQDDRDLIVVEIDGVVTGYATVHWVPFPMVQGREAYVSDLLIQREWRDHGLGRLLLAEVEERARTRGCKRLMLNNRRAAESFIRGFFSKAGFREREEFANFVKPLNG